MSVKDIPTATIRDEEETNISTSICVDEELQIVLTNEINDKNKNKLRLFNTIASLILVSMIITITTV